MGQSMKKNIVMVLLRNLTTLIFPLITFPYLSRVLNPEGMGKVNYASTFSNYFFMLAVMGIDMYGAREIAVTRKDKNKMTKVFKELLVFSIISTAVVFFTYMILVIILKNSRENILFFTLYGIGIIVNGLSIEWLYTGLEKFSYTVIRKTILQSLFIIFTFIFVKSKEDIMLIPLLLLITGLIQLFFNLSYSRKFINYKLKIKLNIKKHIKPILIILSGTIASTIQVNMDIIMLGIMTSDWNVGIYNASIRVNRIVIGLLTSLGAIFYSRLSYYQGNKNNAEAVNLLKKWQKNLSMIVYPCIVGMYLVTDEVILILAGEKYKESIITCRIMIPMLFFSAMINFLSVQLYSQNKEKIATKISIVGVIVGFILNLILIPKYQHNGAAIATISISLVVFLLYLYEVKRNSAVGVKIEFKYLLISLIMGVIVYFIKIQVQESLMIRTFLMMITGVVVYFSLLILSGEFNLNIHYKMGSEKNA